MPIVIEKEDINGHCLKFLSKQYLLSKHLFKFIACERTCIIKIVIWSHFLFLQVMIIS